MKRRRGVALMFIAAFLVATFPVTAERPDRLPIVGVLITHVPLTDPFTEIVRSSFRVLGYEEGRSIHLEFVTALGQLDRCRRLRRSWSMHA